MLYYTMHGPAGRTEPGAWKLHRCVGSSSLSASLLFLIFPISHFKLPRFSSTEWYSVRRIFTHNLPGSIVCLRFLRLHSSLESSTFCDPKFIDNFTMSTYTEDIGDMDIIFAGGGTAACVAAGRLAKANPDLKILLIEGGRNNFQDPTVVNPAVFLSHLAPDSKTTVVCSYRSPVSIKSCGSPQAYFLLVV